MSLNLNKLLIAGHLTRDPELRYTPKGAAACSFGLASNRIYRDGDGNKQETTLFIDVNTWGSNAESCHKYLVKGRNVVIDGRLEFDSWTDDDGNKRSKHKITADLVHFLGIPKKDGDE
tara:strand:+ start:13743 stop:14096 length:354 start_codon:yes stop_codon:yes gene_type:complete